MPPFVQIVPPLVDLLRYDNVEGKACARGALQNIASEPNECFMVVLEEMGLPLTVHFQTLVTKLENIEKLPCDISSDETSDSE